MDALSREYHLNAENITKAIFQKWLDGSGKTPVTWTTLVNVLRNAKLNVLADQIEGVVK